MAANASDDLFKQAIFSNPIPQQELLGNCAVMSGPSNIFVTLSGVLGFLWYQFHEGTTSGRCHIFGTLTPIHSVVQRAHELFCIAL